MYYLVFTAVEKIVKDHSEINLRKEYLQGNYNITSM